MTEVSNTRDPKSDDCGFESQNSPLQVLTVGGSWDFLWAGDSLRLVELGLFVDPSRRDNLERGNLRVPLARGVLTHEALEEGSPALGSLVISWRGRIGVTGACPS